MAKWFQTNYYSLSTLTILPVYVLIEIYDVGYMDIYFYSSLIILIFFVLYFGILTERTILVHNVLKFIIVAGVFCIVLINPSVLWNGKSSYVI
jgi:4-hydroxybenzoate polyprenyltransferase